MRWEGIGKIGNIEQNCAYLPNRFRYILLEFSCENPVHTAMLRNRTGDADSVSSLQLGSDLGGFRWPLIFLARSIGSSSLPAGVWFFLSLVKLHQENVSAAKTLSNHQILKFIMSEKSIRIGSLREHGHS